MIIIIIIIMTNMIACYNKQSYRVCGGQESVVSLLSIQKKPCNTRLQNNLLEPQSYGIALQQDSPYTKKFSVAILKVS